MGKVYLFVWFLAAACAPTTSAAASSYALTEIGVFQADSVMACQINNRGHFLGTLVDEDNTFRSVFWDGSSTQYLNPGEGNECWGYWMNNNDEIICAPQDVYPYPNSNVIWTPSGVRQLEEPMMYNVADMNDHGQVLFHPSYESDGTLHSFLRNADGSREHINSYFEDAGHVMAWAINDNGVIAGTESISSEACMGFLVKDGAVTYLEPAFGGNCGASDINDNAQVAGHTDSEGVFLDSDGVCRHSPQACFWSDGKPVAIGTLGGNSSHALCLNNLGQVLGWSETGNPEDSWHQFLWQDGGIIDLTDTVLSKLGYDQSAWVSSINDEGQLAGWAQKNGQIAGFILTPVPEPSCLAAMVAGLGTLVVRTRVRCRPCRRRPRGC